MPFLFASPAENPYCVPKRQVTAEVILPGQHPLTVRLFLNECAEAHGGRERPSDVLNGPVSFIPATDHQGKVILLQRDAVLAVSVAAVEEQQDDVPPSEDLAPDDVKSVLVEVVLEEGTLIRGIATYLMPEPQRRLQDFLNTGDRFLALREDGIMHLVNKRRIAQVRPA